MHFFVILTHKILTFFVDKNVNNKNPHQLNVKSLKNRQLCTVFFALRKNSISNLHRL